MQSFRNAVDLRIKRADITINSHGEISSFYANTPDTVARMHVNLDKINRTGAGALQPVAH
jgi:hypothetical protein